MVNAYFPNFLLTVSLLLHMYTIHGIQASIIYSPTPVKGTAKPSVSPCSHSVTSSWQQMHSGKPTLDESIAQEVQPCRAEVCLFSTQSSLVDSELLD